MKLLALLLAPLLWLIFPADLLKSPSTIPRQKGSIVVNDNNGKLRWTADWTMAPSTDNGSPAVRFTETGQGRYSPFTQEVHWTLDALWKADGQWTPLKTEKRFTDSKGATLATESKVFETGAVRFERQDAKGKTDRLSINVPADTLTVEGIAGVLPYLPFDSGRPFNAHFFTNEPRLYDVTFEVRGRERVRTPAGEFDCYKVEMVPHMGLLNVFKSFFPKTYFWFTVAPPHHWVRYEGLENGVGTPPIVMQMKSLTAF